MGYGKPQMAELEATINATPCDVVLVGTPLDLRRSLRIERAMVRARYEVEECGPVALRDVLAGL